MSRSATDQGVPRCLQLDSCVACTRLGVTGVRCTRTVAQRIRMYTSAAARGFSEEPLGRPAGSIDYKVSLTVQAVPLLDLLEASATDGFVAQIPLALIEAGKSGGSVAWIAVENPNDPWPNLPGKDASAGPFYLVWQYPERSRVANEQWPYMLERLTAVQSPELRWPQLKVDAALPADAPARHGEEVFVTQCFPCHRLNGGGASDIGPDLGQPMAATDYLTEAGLRAL